MKVSTVATHIESAGHALLVTLNKESLPSGCSLMAELRVAIVGAGIIGLATAYQLAKAGAQVTVIDRDPEADRASTVNAGGIAVTEVFPAGSPSVWWRAVGWMTDPLGPLAIRPAHAIKLIPWLIRFASSSRAQEVERISRAMAAINARAYDDFVPMLEAIGYGLRLHSDGALSLYETLLHASAP